MLDGIHEAEPTSALTEADLVHRYVTGVNASVPKVAADIGPEAAEHYRRRSVESALKYAQNHRLGEVYVEWRSGRT